MIEFDLQENELVGENVFHMNSCRIKTRFVTEAKGNSEIAY